MGEEIEDAEGDEGMGDGMREEEEEEGEEQGEGKEQTAVPIDEPTTDRVSSDKHAPPPPPRPLKRRRSSPPTTTTNPTARSAILISDDENENDGSATESDTDSTASEPNPLSPRRPPRFTFAPPPTTATTHATPPPRPTFILPLPTPASSTIPLPDAFSPHRRGAKYTPNGLAATCLEWILGVESTLPSHTRSHIPGEGEYAAKVTVEACGAGGGMVLVRGAEVGGGRGMEGGGGGEERWVLVGGRGGVREGGVVGVGRPVWEVEVGGEAWGVGVEWKVL